MIRIGPSGRAYKDWEGIVYPAKKPKAFDRLNFRAQYFDAVEINNSFYGPPRATSARSWVESVNGNPDFRFTAKLYQAFTHTRNATAQDESHFKARMPRSWRLADSPRRWFSFRGRSEIRRRI